MASTVLITGASQGIGRAIASTFARHGFNVVLAARSADRLDQAVAELQANHHSAIAVPTDVRDPDQVQNLVHKTLDQFGPVKSYQFFPKGLRWMIHKVFQNQD
ncbi:MAG: SDR family NAD(P)-dependent oxidoreductase [Thainema sp.]